ncbi:hypothetical protein EV193_101228 [Herbihabitans rhizosphaerae]|uniref:Helix-turn-helix domain-containing protein n=1 Tax=Herbihabitans rhizosphaerae TaxID=1872711 RepID=A0A4V2EUF1_9PSEU|nr:helix-turn-helix domain-containing protein [Herbihabitans rhizosphaerae]RZS44353.1 hypothetical protein EV193_101228 [Herbihabitans rhizosphaerae]
MSERGEHPDRVPKRRRLTGVEREILRKRLTAGYARGDSIRALSEKTGFSFGFVQQVLGEAGVLRERGGYRGKRGRLTGSARAAIRDEVVSRYRDGWTIEAVAKKVGRSKDLVQRLLREADVGPADRRMTTHDRAILRQDLSRRYREGRTIAELADWSGRGAEFVHEVLREAGVSLRASDMPPPRERR